MNAAETPPVAPDFNEQFTLDLLARQKRENGYECPKCHETIEDRDDFIKHVQKHLDDFMGGRQ